MMMMHAFTTDSEIFKYKAPFIIIMLVFPLLNNDDVILFMVYLQRH